MTPPPDVFAQQVPLLPMADTVPEPVTVPAVTQMLPPADPPE